MKKDTPMKRLLIVDLEATCWDNKAEAKESEIIEIGICALDLNEMASCKSRGIIVKPKFTTVSKFCTSLTTLTQEDVDKGVSLSEAIDILKTEYKSKSCAWASYGDYDRKQFERECRSKGLDYPFGPRHLNLKFLFSLAFNLPKEVGMDEALEIAGLKLEGTHHRGCDDAWNIAKIAAVLFKRLTKAS